MFIYKFMSNLVMQRSSAQDEQEKNYDPHKHRVVEKPCSYGETMMHMLKGAIGAGILAMPDATRRLGLVNSIFGVLVLGLFANYALQILINAQYELCKRSKRGYMAYPKSMLLAIRGGPPWFRCTARFFYVMTDVMLVVWQLGLCAIYFVFVAVNLQQVVSYWGWYYSVRMWIVFLFPFELLVNLVKTLKLLAPVSSFSNFIISIGLILVLFYLIEDDVILDNEKMRFKGFAEVPIFIGTTLFALEAAGVILALEYNMERPERFVGICGLLSIGMFIIMMLFIIIGVAGYLKYGDEIKASITLNLPQNEKRAQAAKFTFALALFLSFPLQNYVAYEILWRRMQKRIKMTKRWPWDYSLRVVLVIIPFLAAVGIPNLGGFISLLGALCLSLVAFMFPAIMDACVWYPNQFGFLYYKLWRDLFTIVFGSFCLVSGVYTSILEIRDSGDV